MLQEEVDPFLAQGLAVQDRFSEVCGEVRSQLVTKTSGTVQLFVDTVWAPGGVEVSKTHV